MEFLMSWQTDTYSQAFADDTVTLIGARKVEWLENKVVMWIQKAEEWLSTKSLLLIYLYSTLILLNAERPIQEQSDTIVKYKEEIKREAEEIIKEAKMNLDSMTLYQRSKVTESVKGGKILYIRAGWAAGQSRQGKVV